MKCGCIYAWWQTNCVRKTAPVREACALHVLTDAFAIRIALQSPILGAITLRYGQLLSMRERMKSAPRTVSDARNSLLDPVLAPLSGVPAPESAAVLPREPAPPDAGCLVVALGPEPLASRTAAPLIGSGWSSRCRWLPPDKHASVRVDPSFAAMQMSMTLRITAVQAANVHVSHADHSIKDGKVARTYACMDHPTR